MDNHKEERIMDACRSRAKQVHNTLDSLKVATESQRSVINREPDIMAIPGCIDVLVNDKASKGKVDYNPHSKLFSWERDAVKLCAPNLSSLTAKVTTHLGLQD